MNPRRLTPSMSLLLAFESAGRHESFTRAARELVLTQSAVSRQVQALEQLLDVELFRRTGRRIELTGVGQIYLRGISLAVGRIRDASLQAVAHRSGGGSLHLGVLPSVATKWLLPKLPTFYARHPNILLHIHSRIGQFDLALSGIDAAISNSVDGQWHGARSELLLQEELVPVASPQLAAQLELQRPEDLQRTLLMQVQSRPNLWREWFDAKGLSQSGMRSGPIFELTSHLLQAVAASVGVGLVARYLVQDELDASKLVIACADGELRGVGCYFFAAVDKLEHPPLQAFRAWLFEQL